MHGIVNQAIEGLVIDNFGQETWEAIKLKSQVMETVFLNNEPYPDKITYDLVLAANEITKMPVDQILQAFGEYWVLKTGMEKYGALLTAGGENLKEFLVNLPNFHSRIMLMYPKLAPPSFLVENIQDRSLELHYMSHRPGLKDFVLGLIQGLGKMYETPVTSKVLQSRDEGADHEVFLIAW